MFAIGLDAAYNLQNMDSSYEINVVGWKHNIYTWNVTAWQYEVADNKKVPQNCTWVNIIRQILLLTLTK